MNIEHIKDTVNKLPNLSTALGMEFISTPEPDTCMARMKVDEGNLSGFLVAVHRWPWPRI